MTVYDLARKCMKDPDFNKGGPVKNEINCLVKIGFDFTVKDGAIYEYSGDLVEFYRAMTIIQQLNEKYSNKATKV